jgi:hypothetical protein
MTHTNWGKAMSREEMLEFIDKRLSDPNVKPFHVRKFQSLRKRIVKTMEGRRPRTRRKA